VLVSHRDYLTVVGPDLVEAGDALDERSALGHGGPGAFVGERQDRDRRGRRGEDIDPLMPVLKGQVDQRVPGDAAPAGQIEPDRPVGVTRARRAFGAVRDAVGASAAVAPVVRQDVTRMIGRVLLRARPAVFLVGLRLLPPAETREVQGLELFEEPLLHLRGPLLVAFGEVGGVHGCLPGGSGGEVP
jgi:hypothetical protein